jgi:hypothetical protein
MREARGVTRREFLLWLTCIALLPKGSEAAQLDRERAAQVKENLIHHLIQLTRWPESARKSSDPVTIALYGAVDEYLVRLLEARARDPKGKPGLELVRVRAPTDEDGKRRTLALLKASHLVYASPTDDTSFITALHDTPVLTVGEGPDFARNLGIVAFVIEQSRVRLEVNLERARAAQLGFSAQLLQHARIVE